MILSKMGIGLTFGSVKKYFKLLCLSCNNPSPIVISWIRLIYYLRTDNLLFFIALNFIRSGIYLLII